MGIRTPETNLMVYTISNRAPSANSDTSPNQTYYLVCKNNYIKSRKIFDGSALKRDIRRIESFNLMSKTQKRSHEKRKNSNDKSYPRFSPKSNIFTVVISDYDTPNTRALTK